MLTVAKTAGFCFGVDRAVTIVEDLIKENHKVTTLGPIIHNPQVVEYFANKGVKIAENLFEASNDSTLVIRSHGITKEINTEIIEKKYNYCDATCPFVKKIHKIVEKENREGAYVLIAGDAFHPEVVGIKSYCNNQCSVFSNSEELLELLNKKSIIDNKNIAVVSQTTYDQKKWNDCVNILKKVYTNAKIFDTICSATSKRQEEAQKIAAKCDYMVIVGGKHSSNSRKLFELCSQYCDVDFVETAAELNIERLKKAKCVGLTAGASTPAWIIKEVHKLMSEILENNVVEEESSKNMEPVATAEETNSANTVAAEPPAQSEKQPVKSLEEMTDEEAFEYYLDNMNNDKRVKGIVCGITPSEVQVDIGRKQAGYIPMDEYSFDPDADPKAELKIGQEIDLIIMKTNDQEGTVMCSKKRFDAVKNREKVFAAAENGEVLNGTVTKVIKGGVIVMCDGVEFFVPASQATLTKDEPLDDLLHKKVDFKVLEVNKGRRHSVGSIRVLLKDKRREERKAMREEFWASIEEGKVYTGKVKSMTSYGAFVDLGGVDGMVHVSELSWKRIKNPSEVLKEGDVIEVFVKSFDVEKHRVSLGYKKAEDNPWFIFNRDYKVDDVIDVTIVSLTAYGAFAKIIDGVDGLIHISQIANKRIEKPQEVLKVGESVQAKIIAVDDERKRVSLSIRALLPEEEVVETVEVAEVAEETVEEVTEA